MCKQKNTHQHIQNIDMSNFAEIKKQMAKRESLEQKLHLKQLQIDGLLSITQAINNNVPASELYEMYRNFLNWELGIQRMSLYIRCDAGTWMSMCSLDANEKHLDDDLEELLKGFAHSKNLDEEDNLFLKQFDIVIPVLHKDQPIAYVFIGRLNEAKEEDVFGKVQFITTITNVIAVAIENKRLFRRQLDQEKHKQDMELAAEIQQLFIPPTYFKTDRYELAGIYEPRYAVGGDFFDFLEHEDGRFIFCVGDISGKGVAASLLMANFQSKFNTHVYKMESLEQFVVEFNRHVFKITEGSRFLTFFIGEYNPDTQILTYVNAGHNPPLLVTDGYFHALDQGCTILGAFDELPFIEVGQVQLMGQTTILTFTDGLPDILNEEGEMLGEEHLKDFIQGNYLLTAQAFNDELLHQLDDYTQGIDYPDDFTVLTCKIF